MANIVKMKRSAVASKVPTTADLALGEIAINTFDGKVYIKKDNGTPSIVEVGTGGSGTGVTDGDKGDITSAAVIPADARFRGVLVFTDAGAFIRAFRTGTVGRGRH